MRFSRPFATSPNSLEAFIARAKEAGRQILPGIDVEVFWDGMWIFRVGRDCFPIPDNAEAENLPWRSLQGLAAQYLSDAEDFWFHIYRPKPGDVVVDIGAGRGEDTFAFSRAVTASGRVFALEPHPVSFAALNKFCSLNGLSNVAVLNLACVAQPGKLQIETLQDWPSNYTREGDASATSFAVDGVPFDWIWKKYDIGRIDFLKMNIEGGERVALEGCRMALGHTSTVCVAAHDFRADRGEGEWFRTTEFVRKFLTERGFHLIPRHDSRPWARDHIHATRLP